MSNQLDPDQERHLAFVHFLQLEMLSLVHILQFLLYTIFVPRSGAISDTSVVHC